MITFEHKGNFSKTYSYLKKSKRGNIVRVLERYGRAGVDALKDATPFESGLTASSWTYEIEDSGSTITISFCNSNIQNGVPIAVILQYGHGTGTGGWVEGRDYINPAILPIFDRIAEDAWKEVTK